MVDFVNFLRGVQPQEVLPLGARGRGLPFLADPADTPRPEPYLLALRWRLETPRYRLLRLLARPLAL